MFNSKITIEKGICMEEKNINNVEQELDLNQLMKIRREKLAKLQEEGKDPFEIIKFNVTHTSKRDQR